MKKTYSAPSTQVIAVSIDRHLLAESGDYKASDVSLSSGAADNGDAYSRGGNSWDDDDF